MGQGRFSAPSVQGEKLTWGYASAGCSLGQQAHLLACSLLWASAPLSCGSVCVGGERVRGACCMLCFGLLHYKAVTLLIHTSTGGTRKQGLGQISLRFGIFEIELGIFRFSTKA